MKVGIADKVKQIRQLLGAIQRQKNLSAAALQVEKLDQAAKAVEQGMARIEKLRGAIQEARHARDAAAKTWVNKLAALKRGARAAFDDGQPQLYATLFERPTPPRSKSAKPAAAPADGAPMADPPA